MKNYKKWVSCILQIVNAIGIFILLEVAIHFISNDNILTFSFPVLIQLCVIFFFVPGNVNSFTRVHATLKIIYIYLFIIINSKLIF